MVIHIVESGLSTKMSAIWVACEAINKSQECVLKKPHGVVIYRIAGQFHIYCQLIASTGKVDLHYVISNPEDVLEKLNKANGDDLTTVLNSLVDENSGEKQVDKDSNLIVQKQLNDAQEQMRRIKNFIRYMQDIGQPSSSTDPTCPSSLSIMLKEFTVENAERLFKEESWDLVGGSPDSHIDVFYVCASSGDKSIFLIPKSTDIRLIHYLITCISSYSGIAAAEVYRRKRPTWFFDIYEQCSQINLEVLVLPEKNKISA